MGMSKFTQEIKNEIAEVEKLKEEYSIHAICKTLELLKSTYYHRIMRAPEKNGMRFVMKCLNPRFLKYLKTVKNDSEHPR